jgi:hypothetical protein
MYVFGGNDFSGTLNDLHVYDPASGGSWTDLSTPTSGSPPSARGYHSAVELDGKTYVFGGYDVNNLSDLHVYDPASGRNVRKLWTDDFAKRKSRGALRLVT